MLRLPPSLTFRAGAVFVSIYVAVFGAMLVLMSVVMSGASHSGAGVALRYAAADLHVAGSEIRLAGNGRFAGLAARNPSLWLLGRVNGERVAFGPVPARALALYGGPPAELVSGRYNLAGVPRPLSIASVASLPTDAGPALLAAGGVDTASLGVRDSIRLFLEQGLLPLLVLGITGLMAMLLALPALTSGLRRVAAEAGSIRPENPAARMNEFRVPRELLPVVRGFNAALDRLTGELERRKRFIADAAHELKTPLAILSLQVEALREQTGKPDLQRMVTRLSELVAQMLDVERLSINGARRCELDLSVLAADVIADMTPMALACGYDLSLDAPGAPVIVAGDPQALARAIANLLANAVSHGGGGGQIRVVIALAGTLDVLNDGPGVPRSLHAVLFEPFSRGRWDRDGCGLGLHLTREIMRGHGGDALLLDTDYGAAFRLEFPARTGQKGQ